MKLKLVSWNVNGIRAAQRKGFWDWLSKENPFITAIQETKAYPEQLSADLRNPEGFYTYWNQAEKKGYSGVAVFAKKKPLKVKYGFNNTIFNHEGRVILLEYLQFALFNIYFPNGKSRIERLEFKLKFYQEFLTYVREFKAENKGKTIIICGDFNTAHCEIDLARPKANCSVSGFLPQERLLIDELISIGFVDTFRIFNQTPGCYTWWDLKSRARERNVGWRIDYFFINKESSMYLSDAFIMPEVYGSDHCPAGIILEF
ncbi:MAG: exodeoxyribonuclease III [Candidatus Omnitrophota bacterium]|nr:MAG: exodeoxyribonuclease III [Candidatus Omnitrophota bacterium]